VSEKQEIVLVEIDGLGFATKEVADYVHVMEKLLEERDRLLAEIPECPKHGRCVPHATEWVRKHLAADEGVAR
jgi:hypothetical protein